MAGECHRDHQQRAEDGDAWHGVDLRHYERPHAHEARPSVHEQHGLALVETLVNEAVMDVAAVGVPDAGVPAQAPHDGRERVDDGHGGDHERHDDGGEAREARDGEQGHRPEGKAEREGARVSHEDGCRVEVEPEEAERRASHGNGERGGVEPARPDGEHEHGEARDGRDAGGKPVKAVDEVDDVGVGDEVDHGHRVGEPPQVDEPTGDEGVGDVPDDEASRHGDDGGERLAEELLARRERKAVVEQAGEEDDEKREDEQPVVDLEARRRDQDHGPAPEGCPQVLDDEGGDDAEEDGDAPHARDGLLVDPAGVGVVHGAAPHGNPARERRRCERDEEGCREKAQIWHQT